MANTTTPFPASLIRRQIALPQDHGSWVFLLSPLLIGLFAGGWVSASAYLVLAAMAAFLIRQPVTMLVKIYSHRRPRRRPPRRLVLGWSLCSPGAHRGRRTRPYGARLSALAGAARCAGVRLPFIPGQPEGGTPPTGGRVDWQRRAGAGSPGGLLGRDRCSRSSWLVAVRPRLVSIGRFDRLRLPAPGAARSLPHARPMPSF